ncbi:MAG TPA: hypothetical protein VGQ62_17410 [Chloroflexota bacterium]|nr:hypothetical protein [Chloroflexota bacterium]
MRALLTVHRQHHAEDAGASEMEQAKVDIGKFRGLTSKRLLSEPLRTRTENRLIKRQLLGKAGQVVIEPTGSD